MSGLGAFLKENKKEQNTRKIVASAAFTDEQGNPVEWEIRQLKSKELDYLRKECSSVKKGGEVQVDTQKFNAMVASRCTIYPNLNDRELQDSYHVMGAENLIVELLDVAGDYNNYVAAIMKFSNMDKTDKELVEEAKN